MDLGLGKVISETREQILYAVNHLPKNSIPAAFEDSIKIIWRHEDMVPMIIEKKLLTINGMPYLEQKLSKREKLRQSTEFIKKFFGNEPLETERNEGWFFIIHIPPGIRYTDFLKEQQRFADAVMGSCLIEREGKAIKVWLSNLQLKTMYHYQFDPNEYQDHYLPVPFGISSRGPIIKDIADTHWFFAGETRYGKSNLIHCIVYSLLLASSKNKQKSYICIVDLKRIEFPEFDEWAWRVTDIKGAVFMLLKITEEIKRREGLFAKARVRKIQDYIYKGYELPFIVLVIDELHRLQDTASQEMLKTILAVGAGFGVIVIGSTQRPSSTIFEKVKFGDLKANFDGKVSFRASTSTDSQIILDNPSASYLPNIKGRAIFQWDCEVEMQTFYFPLSPKEEPQLNKLLAELGQPRFVVKRSEPSDVKPQKGLLPGPKNTRAPGGPLLLDDRSNSYFGF
ncbi:DNA translocase FtsK [Desulfosporosinus acididurans]|uniref:DNA translocase FtsK n=1 Tax=Desulfosporosinus acididurans TaxID=476652 RepID=A0A0J1FTI8_9FIRM|nr:FtsK/SpoIIIE domain-containing protein [Desulfosporosinus acididurans]KLU66790.1 DNA translocase FtsK [Desulfosporosinus acididurans]